MNRTHARIWTLARLPLAVSLASLLAVPAQAVTFTVGEIEGSFDSTLSVGTSWSTASRDKRFIGSTNGGTGYTQTGDDGRLNFKKGDSFSKIFKGLHDLELRYKDSGLFMRGKYWYDFKLHDQNLRHPDPAKRSISNNGRKEGAKTRGVELLDAFLFHNYMIGDQPGTVRLGKQVVSWGESTFIMNSINSVNPIDVSAFRRPGAELKEGLIPVNMFYVSQNITDRLSAEAFYQLSWKQTVVDNCGTFFSDPDVAADGCNTNYNILSAAERDLLMLTDTQLAGLNNFIGTNYYPRLSELGIQVGAEGIRVPRGKDNKAKDSGQWGMALRWMGDNTEYGAYFMNYHSRTPFASYQNLDTATLQQLMGLATIISPGSHPVTGDPLPSGLDLAQGLLAPALLSNGRYYMDYPEDIRLYGLSFSTTLPTGTAWQGEVSYRPNMPIQINTNDMTAKLAEGIGTSISTGIALGGSSTSAGGAMLAQAMGQAGFGHRGYNRKEVTQLQTTFTHFFDQVLGAERATLIGEVGYVHVGGLESKDKIRYGRNSIFGNMTQGGRHGFVTKNSWGYRMRGQLDYSNVFAGINLKPNLAFSHDVKGYGPNGLFNEGAKAVSIGLDADYRHTYTAGLSYTNFFGGRYNTMTDRDFVSLNFGMSF